ncbi:MAG TPA: GNAT family N-acetyltransferase [Galbitalea sp.]
MSEVIQNQELERFELVEDGDIAGFSEYKIVGNEIIFTHTEILGYDRERGLGSRLVREELDQVREHTDYRVVAQCPFVAHWLAGHPDYQDLLSR